MQNLGAQIRMLRKRAGLTQVELARALGLSGNSLVSRIETGQLRPSDQTLRSLADVFGIEVAQLTTLSSDAEGSTPLSLEVDEAHKRLSSAVDRLVAEAQRQQQGLASFFSASQLNTIWDISQKLHRESQAETVWVMTPDLRLDLELPEVHAVVHSNLARGVRYRYLIPNTKSMKARAQHLLKTLGAPSLLQFRIGQTELFDFSFETVLYDATRADTRQALIVAPTRRPDFDIVLGHDATERFRAAFERRWRSAVPGPQ
ncbi:MAG: helix-turn-helix transcriptional regulator [Myxococcota bacterium]